MINSLEKMAADISLPWDYVSEGGIPEHVSTVVTTGRQSHLLDKYHSLEILLRG